MSRFFKKKKIAEEKSYKTGEYGPRYVRSFRRVKRTIPEDYSKESPPSYEKISEVKSLLQQIADKAQKFEQFKELQEEYILLVVQDLGNYRIAIKVKKGNVEFVEVNEKKASIILPLKIEHLKIALKFMEDDEIDRTELFLLSRHFSIPILKSLYDQPVLYFRGNKTRYKFDDFMQIEIKPDEPVIIDGRHMEIQMTVLNVDGQWLVFKGFEGDPDWRLTLDLDTALKLWWLGTQETKKHSKNLKKLHEISKEFLKILNNNVSYLRDDHDNEFEIDLEIENEDENIEEFEYQ